MSKKNKGRRLTNQEIKKHKGEKFTRPAVDYRSFVYRSLGLESMPQFFATLSVGDLAKIDDFVKSGALAFFEPRGILGEEHLAKAMALAQQKHGEIERDQSARLVESEIDGFNHLCGVQDPGWFSCLRIKGHE